MADNNQETVSVELDAMVGGLLGAFLDCLAEGEDPGVVACVEDAASARYEAVFTDDGEEACLEAARAYVTSHLKGIPADGIGPLRRAAIAYVGCVEIEGAYEDAILVTFHENGMDTAYSAYVLVRGIGEGDDLEWCDPEPAGEEPALIA